MKLDRFFSIAGRLPRGQFWLTCIFLWASLYILLELLGPRSSGAVVWLVNGMALTVLAMLCIRRLHDRNYTGWWLLAVLVPVAGAAWLTWQLACRRGVPQDNRWGTDPQHPIGDYLVVR